MALGIYKPGQGYWVRVMTAALAGAIVLAGAAWVWGQLEALAVRLPRAGWVLTLSPAEGEAPEGSAVTLWGQPQAAGEARPLIARARVGALEPIERGVRVTLHQVEVSPGRDIAEAGVLESEPGGGASLTGRVAGLPQGIMRIEPLYLQAAGASLVLLAGAAAIYYFVGVHPGTVEFLIATDGEMKKVNWSTRREIVGSTWVVIIWSVMIAAGLFVVDLVFSRFFMLIGVLQQ